ncbi:MAG: sigma 54-interacting transcriptional regulator [Desulfobacterales bacterium]|nr:sigma 54-interacting transcriptional regulator [Desulfobacterales bacterium]MDD4072898.1 sigma 54-interacting transcriptional regulator [Desulfobacterales bacterium]MDD4392623.1 sigma 54-interacting transcriptional regulator [Desulfobacterales bacterium]
MQYDFILKSQTTYLSKIKSEWIKFIDGKPVDADIVAQDIYNSWKRSRRFGVDPYFISGQMILTGKEAEEQCISHQELIQSFGSVALIIQEIVTKRNLNVQLFDRYNKSIQLIMNPGNKAERMQYSNEYEKYIIENIPRDASENIIGTNAVCLALKENRPVQIVGAEHFNSMLHNVYCTAAPIHDSEGHPIGALNIVSLLKSGAIDTFGLATCLADIYDNRAVITRALEELHIQDYALRNVIEYLPQGVAYIGEDNLPKAFNSRLLSLFGIKDNKHAVNELNRYFQTIERLNGDEDLKNQEILLDIQGRKKSFLLTIQHILSNNGKVKNKIVMIEDTHSLMKSFQKLKGNQAFYTFSDILGNNQKLVVAKQLAEKIARVRSSVLIYGESGTGKELFAQAIHNESPRKDNPFVAINCGAIPSELIESELFGYEPGAFTGALKGGKPGKLELASGGTLFLDEIESMPLMVQIKLLRALSTQKISKIGGVEEIPIDVRIISATKLDLLQEADEGNFRDDLYYRISTITINLPPLRERTDDIPMLSRHFIDIHSREFDLPDLQIHPEFLNALQYYYWRGNVRELSNVLERAVVLLGNDRILTLSQLPDRLIRACNYKGLKKDIEAVIEEHSSGKGPIAILKMAEEIAIQSALEKENGNMTKAAERLGISKPTLYSKIGQNDKLKQMKMEYDSK